MARYISTEQQQLRPGISYTRNRFGVGNYRVFYSSTTWQVPVGINKVRATLLGAGGGPGGSFIATQQGGPFGSCLPMADITTVSGEPALAHQVGGGGAGGAFVIGTASVTAGCVCCIVVGAGGTTGTTATCYTTPTTTNGSDGGFTCAFGLCATGGVGGTKANCVCCAGVSCRACWALTPVSAGAPASVATGGNIYNSNGIGGSATLGCATVAGRTSSTCTSADVYGGASGSPLGQGTTYQIANPLNSLAFDGSSSSTSLLEGKYDLPTSLYPGQIIYTQSNSAYPVGSTCAGSYWRGTSFAENYCAAYSYCAGY